MNNHKVVSFYHKHLNSNVVKAQKDVFDKLNIHIEQISFLGTHGQAIKGYLESNNWDSITIFDVDCIPLKSDVINNVMKIINNNTIYGNAQVSNSIPYAAPSFLSFTRDFWETSTHKSFEGAYYNNVEADCAEIFTRENEKQGRSVVLSYPNKVLTPKWTYNGNNEYPSFTYGNGTFFENNTFHNFQIRLQETQEQFINFINTFLYEQD
jgi:hypothetical protein